MAKKDCDICKKSGKSILELNLLITQNGFSAAKNVGILFLNIMTILMVEQESQTEKSSSTLNCKTFKISIK